MELSGRLGRSRALWTIAAVAILSAGCADADTITAGQVAGRPAVECHFPTTVPGGTLPQPQCDLDAEAEADADPDPPAPIAVSRWQCPGEDYPITVAAHEWQPYLEVPGTLPACGGGDLADIALPVALLVPAGPLDGIDDDSTIGVSIIRQPGGLFWHVDVSVPADDPLVELEVLTIGDAHPVDVIVEWRTDRLEERCPVGSEALTIRGEPGCRQDETYSWLVDDSLYSLRVGLDLPSDRAVSWIDGWRATPCADDLRAAVSAWCDWKDGSAGDQGRWGQVGPEPGYGANPMSSRRPRST